MRHVVLLLCGAILIGLAPDGEAGGDKRPAMLPLWANQPDKDNPGIYVHRPAADKANGAAVVICPGGGYGGLAISYEGHDVARWLNTLGVTGIVLKYRHAPKHRHPVAAA